jgi:hypothetical protein
VRLALAFCKRAAAKLLFCVVVINALATDVTAVRPPPVPREKDFTRPTGIDPIDTYLAAWFLSIFFEGAMDLVAAFQARSLSNAGPSATPFARRAPFLEAFLSRRLFLSAQDHPSLSIPTYRNAFHLRFCF